MIYRWSRRTVAYLGKRDATIYAWFGDDLETTTSFELVA